MIENRGRFFYHLVLRMKARSIRGLCVGGLHAYLSGSSNVRLRRITHAFPKANKERSSGDLSWMRHFCYDDIEKPQCCIIIAEILDTDRFLAMAQQTCFRNCFQSFWIPPNVRQMIKIWKIFSSDKTSRGIFLIVILSQRELCHGQIACVPINLSESTRQSDSWSKSEINR